MAAMILMWLSLSASGADAGPDLNRSVSSPADIPYNDPRILFHSNRDGDSEVYVVRADGTALKKLTDNSYNDAGPVWSPDGKKIAFGSDRDGNGEIYVMNADGSEQKRLTYSPIHDGDAEWSPDGTRIVFYSMRRPRDRSEAMEWHEKEGTVGLHMEIHVVNADGSELKKLTDSPIPSCDYCPTWSPDGKKIAFTSRRDGNYEVYVMNSDGSEQKRLTHSPALDAACLWSPDGTKMTFVSSTAGHHELCVMNPDGTGKKRLAHSAISAHGGFWSPDGEKITYGLGHSRRETGKIANVEIYVMNSDGSEQRRLTNTAALDASPRWSPDGRRIVYESRHRDGNIDIYVMNADGSDLRLLTDNPAQDAGPRWSPLVPSQHEQDKNSP
jgi:TolB protein